MLIVFTFMKKWPSFQLLTIPKTHLNITITYLTVIYVSAEGKHIGNVNMTVHVYADLSE